MKNPFGFGVFVGKTILFLLIQFLGKKWGEKSGEFLRKWEKSWKKQGKTLKDGGTNLEKWGELRGKRENHGKQGKTLENGKKIPFKM